MVDEIATSALSTELGSVISTDAIPTSSGFVEPAGRSVIFGISVVDNQKRTTNKRQAIGEFVGNDNPQICTFAATFNLAEGQLFEDGALIYYSGESYKELSGLDSPPSGSITKTFEGTGRLAFGNSALPDGRAGFRQIPDGIVYVTFTNGPVGCISVKLVVYDGRVAIPSLLTCADEIPVTQCQDGQLIGDGDETATPSETIPQDTATTRETDPTMTSGIEDATTVQISYSSSDFMAQSEMIGTSLTSDLGVSDMVSSENTLADSTIPDTIITGTTPKVTSTIDTIITDTTIVDTTISDGAITNTATTNVTVANTSLDTESLTTSTIGVDVSTGDTTDITTTAASTTTTEASTTGSGASDTDCIKSNNPYTASNGVTFTLSCNIFISAVLIKDPYVSDWISCLQACSEIQACVGVSSYRVSSIGFDCWLWSSFDVGSARDDESWDIGIKDPVIADATTAGTGTETMDTSTAGVTTTDVPAGDTATADIPTSDTTTSAAPTESSGLPTCGDLSNPVQVDDDTYDIFCNTYGTFSIIGIIEPASFLSCIQACSQRNNCLGLTYEEEGETCYLCYNFRSQTFEAAGRNSTYRR